MYSSFAWVVNNRVSAIHGSGLGLAIAKQMVSLMDGGIACKSSPGEVATFTVTVWLPIAKRLTDSLMLPSARLLMADNDPIFLEAADLFSSMGFTADRAMNG